jgi:hypothetical protein
MVDRLNIKKGMWPKLMGSIKMGFPGLEDRYRSLPRGYFDDVKSDILRLCRIHGLSVEFCY